MGQEGEDNQVTEGERQHKGDKGGAGSQGQSGGGVDQDVGGDLVPGLNWEKEEGLLYKNVTYVCSTENDFLMQP